MQCNGLIVRTQDVGNDNDNDLMETIYVDGLYKHDYQKTMDHQRKNS